MFEGFSKQTIDFMWGIRFNNEKSWFEAHKDEYLACFYRPMQELGRTVYAAMEERHRELGLIHKVSRIYRDARRLHGQGPYKDHLWFSMERPTDDPWTCRPVFWFELGPENWTYGLGYYSAPPVTMAKFRARLDQNPKPFETLARAFEKQDRFQLEGQDYKRPKGECTSLLAPWYNKRSLSLTCTMPNEGLLFTPALADCLIEGYEWLTPYYQYFISLEGDRDPRKP